MIDLCDLEYRHQETQPPLFSHLNLSVPAGEKLAIQGASGVGKTTLIYLLAGLLPISGGSAEIDGFKLHDQRERDITAFRNRRLGVIFQEYNLLSQLTVEENLKIRLAIAGTKRSEVELRETLDRVGMADYLSRPVNSLSGGQQQRIALVRALITDPDVILADEPTGNLDDKSAAYIVDVLMKDTPQTVLIASHDARLLVKADRRLEFLSLCGHHETTVN